MGYISGVVGRTLFVCLFFYLPYAIFWQLPVAIGKHIQQNQYISKNCWNAGIFCQWAEGGVALFVWGFAAFFVIALVVGICGLLGFIFAEPKKKVD